MSRISFVGGGRQEQSSMKGLFPLYSISGTLVLLLEQKLTKKNLHETNSEVIFAVPKRYVKKNSLVKGDRVVVKGNSDSFSLQYRWNCPDTGGVVAFQETPWETQDDDDGEAKLDVEKENNLEESQCLYIYSNMVYKTQVEAMKEIALHVKVDKIPKSIKAKEGTVRVALLISYNSQLDDVGELSDSSLALSIHESEKNEKAANQRVLDLLGLTFDMDPGSLSLDWDTVLGCLVVVVPYKKPTEVYNMLKKYERKT